MRRLLAVVTMTALVVIAGFATRAPAIEVQTFFLKGYNSVSSPSATVTDSIGDALGVSETWTSHWFPIFGAKSVFFHVMTTNAAVESLASVFVAVHDTSTGGVETSFGGGSNSADRMVLAIGSSAGSIGFDGGVARLLALYPNNGSSAANNTALAIGQAWCRLRIRSKANSVNTNAAVLRGIRIRAHLVFDGTPNTQGVYTP